MCLEHQHAGQTPHPVDIPKPGLRGRIHGWPAGTGAVYKTTPPLIAPRAIGICSTRRIVRRIVCEH